MRRSGTSPGRASRAPAISLTITRYLIASLLVRMPPAGFTPTCWPVASRKSRTASSITSVTGRVAAGWILPVEVLMKCAAGHHRQPAGAADVVVGLQLAGLEDHLEMRTGTVRADTGLAHGHDLLVHLEVAPGEERAPVDHHVDLVGTGLDGVGGVGQLDVQCGTSARERCGDRGDMDTARAEGLLGHRDHVGVHAHGGRRGTGRVGRIGAHRLGRQRPDLARSVHALEGGEVDHPDREVDRLSLRVGLDRPGAERGGPLLRTDLVDSGQSVQEPAQRRVARRLLTERRGDR